MKKRVPQIDALYTIGIILAVLGHSHPSDWTLFARTPYETLIVFIYTFHMPLFFFLAGFTFYRSKRLTQTGYARWLSDKAARLLIPYFALSVLAILPKSILEGRVFGTDLLNQLLSLLLRPRLGVWGHFWFLPALFTMYALFGLWRQLAEKNVRSADLRIVCAVTIAAYFLPLNTNWLGLQDLKTNLVFFAVGMLASQGKEPVSGEFAWFVRLAGCFCGVGLSILLFCRFNENKSARLLMALLMIFACCQATAGVREHTLIRWLSAHALTIYLYSWPVQAVVMFLLLRIGVRWQAVSACMFGAGSVVPILMIWIYERAKRLHSRPTDLLLGVK